MPNESRNGFGSCASGRTPGPLYSLLVATTLFTLGCTSVPSPAEEAPTEAAQKPTVVYLVRHAETTPPPYDSEPPDPQLRELGAARAVALARVLAKEPIDVVYSTDYRRTRETAAPAAEHHGLEVQLYDPRDLGGFAERLRAGPGRYLVVGHSNTTPALVEALGGEPGSPIDEATEFDRLYVVTLQGEGPVVTSLLRYGPAAN